MNSRKKNKDNKKKSIVVFLLLILLFLALKSSFALTASAQFLYTPMEKIPGFEQAGADSDFPGYLLAITKFAIWTVGIAALFMISWGGFMYITSAGNVARASSAKGIIADAIFGLAVVMGAWLFLYVINPDLVMVELSFKPVVSPSTTRKFEEYVAKKYKTEYEKTGKMYDPEIPATMPKNCNASKWQEIFKKVASQQGIDKCILQATAAKESSCNQVPKRTYGGQDCSVMQIRAEEHCKTTCADLEKNPEKAVACAANLLKTCMSIARKNPTDQYIRDIYACYNGGTGALLPSRDCTKETNTYGNAYVRYDCPKDCGGYCPVPARTNTFLKYYIQCKGIS